MKILILCTGNSCRSQMARGFLQSFDDKITVRSAGTEPAKQINQRAVIVMKEVGIDVSHNTPKLIDQYLKDEWDYVINSNLRSVYLMSRAAIPFLSERKGAIINVSSVHALATQNSLPSLQPSQTSPELSFHLLSTNKHCPDTRNISLTKIHRSIQ